MDLLLDTHVLLWALDDSDRLSEDTKAMIQKEEILVYVSMATLWELQIR